jgi:uncharacterized protein YbcC (UPF0753/DUF2309 family)
MSSTADLAVSGKSFAERFEHWILHLDHVLPSQAPIRDFVHHNTLHGYQHLPFDQALAVARRELGIAAFWPVTRFRDEFAVGRINTGDLEAALEGARGLRWADLDSKITSELTRRDVWRAALRFPCAPISTARLRWEIAEGGVLERIPDAIATESRRWRHGARTGELADLWQVCSELALPLTAPLPEEPIWPGLANILGKSGTLRDLILQLSGEDILDSVRSELIRHLAAHLDQGLASWHNPERSAGFYNAWRHAILVDPNWSLAAQHDTLAWLEALPADPVAAIEGELGRLGLPEEAWEGYLRQLAMQLPGWSGMFLWRHSHPGYAGQNDPVRMSDYLAVRLVLENIAAEAVARRVWGVSATLPALAAYFGMHSIELRLRLACHRGELPEALASRVQQMEAPGERAEQSRAAWNQLAAEADDDAVMRGAAEARLASGAWPLFRLALALGLDAKALRGIGAEGSRTILTIAGELDSDRAGYLWLLAYEHNYSEQIFAALTANVGRGRLAASPEVQLVLCMDDREEGFRRHIEEINPRLETLGGAAHFGVFQNWRGLGDREVTPLCPVVPVVIVPSHEVHEVPRKGHDKDAASRQQRLLRRHRRRDALLQRTRFGLLSAAAMSLFVAPGAFLGLLGRALFPAAWGRFSRDEVMPPTQLSLTASGEAAELPATPEHPRLGFTDDEQADRVASFLTALGLTRDFAPLVVIMGHGSNSQNNPHLAAYDCGACSGRHSGPNARLFSSMVNRSAVRQRLHVRGIVIPADCWFIGAEHNTADDRVEWYDLEDLPEQHKARFAKLRQDLRSAGEAHAGERCRRLMSAPLGMTPAQSWQHVSGRRNDYAQPRPELGHVTNAAAFIGRRTMSRGAFFDRRAFLISYDPTRDPEGAVLTRHLTINGPVGAGINLEYYFSTVNNERFGCGTKTMHNVTGGFGVMAGGSSDLRTGLPRQMIEIHEPMRLLVVVEQTTAMLTAIYQAQPAVRELVGNGWIVLAALDPDPRPGVPLIQRFDVTRGWLPWEDKSGAIGRIKQVRCSRDWFAGHREPLSPVLLSDPVELAA